MDFEKIGVIAVRMLRVFVISAIGAMALVAPESLLSWGDIAGWLNALAIAGTIGGFSGIIAGFDKWFRWTED